MAEVPLPIPTQAPVPSTDIRNAVFAGAKLDEEVTGSGEFYIDRLGVKRLTNTGRNNQFYAAQQDREDRFNTFIQNSGYDIIGDYTVGTIPDGNPLTVTEYNQLVRYNNELYKLTAATDIPFTTSGKTDETWTDTDSAHFVSVGDAALRQKLGSGEGQLLIGAPGYIEELRQIELSILDSVKTDGAITPFDGGMAEWIFDSSDLSHEVINYPRLFIAPNIDPTGASGAWRLNVGDIINAVQYGLGLTDDLAYNRDIIQQLAYWNKGKRLIILPPLTIRTLPILIQGVDPKMMGTFGATAGATGGNGTCLAIYDNDQYTLDGNGDRVYQSFFKVTSSTASGSSRVTGLFLKYIKIVSLDFFSNPNRGEFTERSIRTGFELEFSGGQVDIYGLVSFGFERSFIGNELWDGSVLNCRVMYGSNPEGTVPAVSFGSTSNDNSNNLNVFHFHIEFCPYAIDFGFCEHVHFFGLKVESHRQEDSVHPVVTIRHESAKLNITNSMFVTNPSTLAPFMQDYGRWTRIVNCSFSGGTPNSKDKYAGVRWLDSRNQNTLFEKEYVDVSFDNCLPSDGTTGGTDFPVIFGHYSTFKGRASAAASGTTSLGAFNSTNSGLISVGYSCSVDLFYNFNNSTEKTAGSLVYFRNKKSNLLRAATVEGGTTPYRLIGGDNDNSISTIGAEWGSTASGIIYCYGKKTMYLSASGNYTQLVGVTGQIIAVKATATGCTLINSANLILLGGVNLSMVLNKYYTFAIESGTLARQIS